MNDQEINIAIAEACGWTRIHLRDGIICGRPPGVRCEGNGGYHSPDYCHDLNAMHEAETTLCDAPQWKQYAERLGVCFERMCIGNAQLSIHATARQRAEAFLKAIGKWKEAE